jgi:hemoglobin
MKKRIEEFGDVQLLVRTFYNKILSDELLGDYFSFVASHHWDKHLEVLDRFWNNILFYAGGYEGNPLQVHQTLHHFKKLDRKDFERWLQLFNQTVDELFEGEKAALAKQRALSIATVMQIKILREKPESASLEQLSKKQDNDIY